jgi:hypothetical protein
MKTRILGLACAAGLTACTQAQRDEAAVYQAQFAAVCQIAMASGWANPYVVPVCSTEALIARFALDPRIWAWVNDIAGRVRRG